MESSRKILSDLSSYKDIDEMMFHMELIRKKAELRAENIEKVKKFYKPLRNCKISIDFKPNQSVSVLMHQYAITNSNSNNPILGTFGAGPCLILALYDSQSSIAALAHIDAHSDISCLSNILKYMSQDIVAHLHGGSSHSADLCIKVIDFLNKNDVDIINTDIGRYGVEKQASLAIDARTGNIYSPIRYENLSLPKMDMEIELKNSTQLNECFKSINDAQKTSVNKKKQDKNSFSGFKKGFLLKK